MRSLPPELVGLSHVQAGVLHHRQIAKFGIRARDIDRRIAAGIWQRLTSRVIVTHALPVQRLQTLWAAAIHHERVGLTGAAALEIEGLPPARDARVDLLGPHGERALPFAGCRLATSITEPEFIDAGGPPRTSIPTSVAFAMGASNSLRQAVFHCTWVVQRRLVTLDEIRAEIAAQPRSPRSVAARRVLDTVDPGVHSVHEYDFAKECKRRGLPAPTRQVMRRDSRGRARYTDVEFRVGGRSVIVEVDGLGHLEPEVFIEDQWRANEMTLQDATVLRLPALTLRVAADSFFEQLGRALRKAAA